MKKSPWTEAGGSKNRQRSDGADEDEDPLNPAIPRAPLIPHDIARMPNAALPVWSHPPEDRGTERPTLGAGTGTRDHVDARPPPGATPSTYQSAAMPPHSESLPRIARVSVGHGSGERGLAERGLVDTDAQQALSQIEAAAVAASPRPTSVERQEEPHSGRARWIAVAIVLGVALLAALWASGTLTR